MVVVAHRRLKHGDMLRIEERRQLLRDGMRLRRVIHAQSELVYARRLKERLHVWLGHIACRKADDRGVGQTTRACEARDGERSCLAANLQVDCIANFYLLGRAISKIKQDLSRSRQTPLDDLKLIEP